MVFGGRSSSFTETPDKPARATRPKETDDIRENLFCVAMRSATVRSGDDKARPSPPAIHPSPSRGLIYFALVTVYLVWGSTYLGIRFAIESLPPFFMGGCRFMAAGLMMVAWASIRGVRWPGAVAWRDAFIVGGCLLLGGNGAVSFAERYVSSGETALIVACVPIFMTLFAWFGRITPRPGIPIFFAMALGLGSVGLLVRAGAGTGQASPAGHLLGVIVILFGCIVWSFGSLYTRQAKHAESPVLSTGIQMCAGGLLLFVASRLSGETATLNLGGITQRSFLAWIYLVTVGAVIGYSTYIWLVRVAPPALVGTYAFVNPAVAVVLGCLLGAEPISITTVIGAGGIVLAVAIIVLSQRRA
jgi:drug/metabolite transporter (DMT)-like permease